MPTSSIVLLSQPIELCRILGNCQVTLSQLLKLILSLLSNPSRYILLFEFFLKIVPCPWLVLKCPCFGSSKPPILCHSSKSKSCKRYPQGILILKVCQDTIRSSWSYIPKIYMVGLLYISKSRGPHTYDPKPTASSTNKNTTRTYPNDQIRTPTCTLSKLTPPKDTGYQNLLDETPAHHVLYPPNLYSDGGKEDTDATGGIRVGEAAAGIVFATEVPILPVTAGVPCSGSGVISESDVGSLGSSSIDVPGPIPGATTGTISGPSTDSSSERSITGIGSLSGMISLREYEDDDDDVVLLGSSTRVPSLYVHL
ncbi:hypothetical protein M9H77_35127 [Catharanthus roseus]|uniref:Uncharacterized protein n=1 Tax=Catharanthus roseus TaxID=4058 RepID=A0ACB9ZQ94_CATRO|nr:hypothetical protein M9H77_35127 [Catharanthus roseus]